MATNLQKGQRENINAPKFTIGLGWDTNSSTTGVDFDLDASAFLLNKDRKLEKENHRFDLRLDISGICLRALLLNSESCMYFFLLEIPFNAPPSPIIEINNEKLDIIIFEFILIRICI